jgi:hypothetical protein
VTRQRLAQQARAKVSRIAEKAEQLHGVLPHGVDGAADARQQQEQTGARVP